MKILLIIFLLLCQTPVFAQTKKLRWSTEMCEFEGTYNAARHSRSKLKNTLKLFSIGSYRIETDATPRRIEDIKKLNPAALDREYSQKAGELKKLDIIRSPYWEALRRKKLKELEQVYQLSRTTMLAYENPAWIKKHPFADSCIRKYAGPLATGGDELLRAWREVNEASRRVNADPERLRKIFESEMRSPDKFVFARVEVMTFGWWNCANDFIEYEGNYDRHEREFRKLFVRTRTVRCDEP